MVVWVGAANKGLILRQTCAMERTPCKHGKQRAYGEKGGPRKTKDASSVLARKRGNQILPNKYHILEITFAQEKREASSEAIKHSQ